MRFSFIATLLAACLSSALDARAQPQRMSDQQQAWFYCLVSTEWCWAESPDNTKGGEKGVAMVAAKRPLTIKGRPSRVTLQVACSDGKPVTMLHSGREIEESKLFLRYKVAAADNDVTAVNASAGHFFEFPSQDFLSDLKGSTNLVISVSVSSDARTSPLEFNVSGAETMLKRLPCYR